MTLYRLFLTSLPVDVARRLRDAADLYLVGHSETPLSLPDRTVDMALHESGPRLAALSVHVTSHPAEFDRRLAYRLKREFAFVVADEILPPDAEVCGVAP